MNKTPRLSKSGIEYLDYSWGVFSGCHNLEFGICPVKACWAKSITTRFSNHYPNGFKPTFYYEALESPRYIKKPSRIGVGWVGDVIGYGHEYRELIFNLIETCPQHTFLFLTKNSENLAKWSPFPSNCWVGVSATNREQFLKATNGLNGIEARVKFLSLEPLLGHITYDAYRLINTVNLAIIGQQTPIRPKTTPKLEWIEEIEEAADRVGIPVFEKNNLASLFKRPLKQDLPK